MCYIEKYSRSVVVMSTLWVCLIVICISQTATSMVIGKKTIINATRPRYVIQEGGVSGKTASYRRARLLPVAIPVSSTDRVNIGVSDISESNEPEEERPETPHRGNRVRRADDEEEHAAGYSSDYAYEEIQPKSLKRKRLMVFTTIFCWVCWIAIALSIVKALVMLMV